MRHLLAVQAQDARAVRLALIERGGDFRDGLAITWLMRGTLHLVDAEDLPWLHALTAPRQVTGSVRRLRQLGVSEAQAERAVELIVRAVSDDGPLTREALAERLAARDIPVGGQAIVHLLHRAAMEGRVALDVDRRFLRLDLPAAAATATTPSTSSPAATTPPTRARRPTTSPTGPASHSATPARHPRRTARRRPGTAAPAPGLRRAPARLARPLTHRPARVRPPRPPGRRHPAPDRARERRRRRHLDPPPRRNHRHSILNFA